MRAGKKKEDLSTKEVMTGVSNIRQGCSEVWTPKSYMTVSECAAQNRVMPAGSQFPGPWSNDRTPYLVEIMDNLSAYSGIQRTIVVKGTQLGLTTAAENGLGYWMDSFPSKILFVSATQEILDVWVALRLEKMIDDWGLRKKIFSQSINRANKKTGDTTFLKEFLGGFLRLVTAQSGPALRNVDPRILFRDEIAGYPKTLRTGEGNPLAVSVARTDSWGTRKKIFDFSTPIAIDDLIWPEYEAADMRRFFVPCPHCGEKQILEFGHGFGIDDPGLGMQWELADGKIKKVWYVCSHCRKEIQNREKRVMLPGGEWRPTSQSYDDKVRSYHVSSLYSPPGMLDWSEIVRDYLAAEQTGADKMRSFVNTRLGLPYRETGARPDWTKVIELRGDYRAGTVPKGVIFLTASVDVQRGQEKEDGRPARLEMEVCGHGIGYRTWSIEHRVFEGSTENEHEGAWADLANYWRETMMTYSRADGAKFQIKMAYVDSGDNTHTVYAFCGMWQGVIPSKGMATVKRRKDEPLDEDMNRSIRRFRIANLEGGQILAEINGPFYKKQVYTNLKIPRKYDTSIQQANFCDFPIDYGEDYYKQLTAEEMIQEPDGNISFKKSSARPNEALDLRVLNLCARDHYLDQIVQFMKADAKNRGYTAAALEGINSRTALEWMDSLIKAQK